MLREELRLLGVGSVGGVDDQGDSRMRRRGSQPVERRRHVGTHRLALAVGERARVSAPARHRGETGRRRRGGLRHGVRLDGDPATGRAARRPGGPTGQPPPVDRCDHLGPDAHGGERASIRKGDPEIRGIDAISARRLPGDRRGSGEVLPLAQMARVEGAVLEARGDEEARKVVAKGARPRQGREVRPALNARRPGRCAAERGEHRGREEDHESRADRQRKPLASLRGEPRGGGQEAAGESRDPPSGPASDLEPRERPPRGHQPERT